MALKINFQLKWYLFCLKPNPNLCYSIILQKLYFMFKFEYFSVFLEIPPSRLLRNVFSMLSKIIIVHTIHDLCVFMSLTGQ